MSARHIPTISEIVDQITVRLESGLPDLDEHEALTAALTPLEDHMARTARIDALTTLAELSIAIRCQPDERGGAA